jgi:preprotein translocase subunit SecD
LASIDAGYSRALSAILDANITTLIATILLYQFGSGPVRGFAVTLTIGLLASMYTAVTLSRIIVLFWFRQVRPATLPI